ncbi:hypothetical protein [Cellulosimicrobium sp. I38E]|uniref:hypothetical protein n=1 Tax=Cellulosimicrobium sp. I38E TaxID=1393139 RepID=UPI0007D9DF0E|nr:hypothetical protein [Cellulosimicrobium sp. I38E]
MDDKVLVTRVIEVLADRCGWAWRPAGPAYTEADDVGLYYGPIGTTPNRAVGVTLYAADDGMAEGALSVRRVQLRFRGAPRDPSSPDELASRAFDALAGLSRVAGFAVVTPGPRGAPMGVDGNHRSARADSYQIIIDLPED